jgi:NAD(P)-dependent dehydrogenase (short-subunit alcohol dehydrogenase family)
VTTTCLIVGGSSGLGRALAERFAQGGYALVLVSSDARDTEALAADLRLRHKVDVAAVACDLARREIDLVGIDRALEKLPPLEGVLIPAGMNRDEDRPGAPLEQFEAVLAANFYAPCRVVDHYLGRLRSAPNAIVVGFGSIAATRGRTRNAAYSAAKRALASYFESLRHALRDTPVRVQFYVLGYLDTNLSFAQDTKLPRAAPVKCAEHVFRRRHDDAGVVYYPHYWRPICAVLRLLPWFVFRKLSF